MSENSLKGKSLEKAVMNIEKYLIQENPNFKNAKTSIVSNYEKTIEGIKTESDIYVEIDLNDPLYNQIIIFECKNWKDSISWEVIAKLDYKLRLLNAQKGYIVANNFTKGAYEFIIKFNLENRISLIKCKNFNIDNPEMLKPVIEFDGIFKLDTINLKFISKKYSLEELIMEFKKIGIEKIEKSLEGYINRSLKTISQSHSKTAKYNEEEKYKVNLSVDAVGTIGKIIDKIETEIKYVYIKKQINPKINLSWDIQKRGKFIEVEFETPAGQNIILTQTVNDNMSIFEKIYFDVNFIKMNIFNNY